MDPIEVKVEDGDEGHGSSFNSSDVLEMYGYGLGDSLTSSASSAVVLAENLENDDDHDHDQGQDEDQDGDIEVIDENGNVEGIDGCDDCDEIFMKKGGMTLSQMELETSSEFDLDMDVIPTELDQEIAAIEGLEVISTITLADGWSSSGQLRHLIDEAVAAEESQSLDSIEIINDPYQDMIEEGLIQSMKTMSEGVDLLCDIIDHEQRKLDLDLETDDSDSSGMDLLEDSKEDATTAGGDHAPENTATATTTTMAVSDNNLLRQLHLEDEKPFFDRIKRLSFSQQDQRPQITYSYSQFSIFALIIVAAILPIILTIGTMLNGGSGANDAFDGIKKSFDIETKMRKIELMMEAMTHRNLKNDGISMEKISEIVKLFEDHRKVTESLYREMSYGDLSDDLKLKIIETLKFNTDTIFDFDRIIDGKIIERIRFLQERVTHYTEQVDELLTQNGFLNRKLNEHKDTLNALINGNDRLCNVISTRCALAIVYHAPKNAIFQLATIIYDTISGFFQTAYDVTIGHEFFWGKKKN